mmetsp:Transcript_94329/g.266360  ORF Transcript_94329/g.266360 Transcript_94329/m.266360 type:complete len:258 (+) Transcript_94329:742-1515(+)
MAVTSCLGIPPSSSMTLDHRIEAECMGWPSWRLAQTTLGFSVLDLVPHMKVAALTEAIWVPPIFVPAERLTSGPSAKSLAPSRRTNGPTRAVWRKQTPAAMVALPLVSFTSHGRPSSGIVEATCSVQRIHTEGPAAPDPQLMRCGRRCRKQRWQELTCLSGPRGCPNASKKRAKITWPSPSLPTPLHATTKPPSLCGLAAMVASPPMTRPAPLARTWGLADSPSTTLTHMDPSTTHATAMPLPVNDNTSTKPASGGC